MRSSSASRACRALRWLALLLLMPMLASADALPALGPPALEARIAYEDPGLRGQVQWMEVLVWHQGGGSRADSAFLLMRMEDRGAFDSLEAMGWDHPLYRHLSGHWTLEQLSFSEFDVDSFQVLVGIQGAVLRSEVTPWSAAPRHWYYQMEIGRSGVSLHAPWQLMPWAIYFRYLAATLLCELMLALLFNLWLRQGWRLLVAMLGVNLITHLPAYLVVTYGVLPLLPLEVCVWVVESALLWLLIGRKKSLAWMVMLSIAANLFSAFSTVLVSILNWW